MSLVVVSAAAAASSVALVWPYQSGGGRGRWPRAWLLAPGSAFLVPVLGHWVVPSVIVGAAALWARTLWRRRKAARRAADLATRVVEVCELLAAELAAGRPPPAALEEAATVCAELRPVAETAALGGDVPGSLRSVAETPGAAALRPLAGAWAISHRTGAGLAGAIRRVADLVRAEQETDRVVAAELSSARATARLVAGLPVLALAMGSGAGASPWHFLLATPAGLVCLGFGLAVGLAGLGWIEAIARGVSR
jgi:tight adherence protein B